LREILERCKRRFGVTSNCFEGGFILPDGSLLDFSGKTGYESDDPRDWGRVVRPDLAGFHNVDHREIDLCVESVPGSDPVYIFQCQGGATRFFKSSDGDLNVRSSGRLFGGVVRIGFFSMFILVVLFLSLVLLRVVMWIVFARCSRRLGVVEVARSGSFTIVSDDLPWGLHRVRCLETGGFAVGGFYSSRPDVCSIDNIDSGFPRSFPRRGVGSLLLGRWLSDMYRRGWGVLGEPVDWFESGKPSCWRIVRDPAPVVEEMSSRGLLRGKSLSP